MSERSTQIKQLEAQFIPEVKKSFSERKPLSFGVDGVRILRNSLEESGMNFDISSKEREALVSGNMLRARVKFKDLEVDGVEIYDYDKKGWKSVEDVELRDRTLGMNAMLGEERFEDIIEYCYLLMRMVEYDGRIGKSKHEGTRGRGFTQAAADILQIALQDPSEESLSEDTNKAITRLNKRFLKGLLKTTSEDEHEDIITRFQAVGIEKPKKTMASFDPGMLPTLVYYLSGYIG